MNAETLLQQIIQQCDLLRSDFMTATQALRDFERRLEQINQQLHKGIEVRDVAFPTEFNDFCATLRQKIDNREIFWSEARQNVRVSKPADWNEDLALSAKSLASRAKTLSRACDEFTTAYDVFCKDYKHFTAAKLNVWLLTSCQTDMNNLTGKILFLSREIIKRTEQNRGKYVCQ